MSLLHWNLLALPIFLPFELPSYSNLPNYCGSLHSVCLYSSLETLTLLSIQLTLNCCILPSSSHLMSVSQFSHEYGNWLIPTSFVFKLGLLHSFSVFHVSCFLCPLFFFPFQFLILLFTTLDFSKSFKMDRSIDPSIFCLMFHLLLHIILFDFKIEKFLCEKIDGTFWNSSKG